VPLQLDTNQTNLVIRPLAASTAALHKAPLAPKQGLGGALANARGQHQSPIAGTYALRTPRGKITSIACESCRKRKSKVRMRSILVDSSTLTRSSVRWREAQVQHVSIQKPHMCLRCGRRWENDNPIASPRQAISQGVG
jgi:hypothetical protein